jgi:arylsulfatase
MVRFLSVAAVVLMLGASAWSDDRPNIVVILVDDMGWSDIGCYGGEVRTPNIDALAAGGVRFTQFYNTAKCQTTRAELLTGLYAYEVGLTEGITAFSKNSVTLAEALNPAGYRTLMAGKWHAHEIPVKRGFSRHYGLTDGCCNFFNPGIEALPGQGMPGRKLTRPRRWAIDDKEYLPFTPPTTDYYTTDAFTDYAMDYLDEYKDEDKPFLLYMAYTAPHYPLHALPEDIAKYRGKYRVGWDVLRARRYKRQMEMDLFGETVPLPPRDPNVPAWEDVPEADKDNYDLEMAVYAAMIDRLDQNIGRLMAKIRALGKEENTLVMFLSDNGACAENPDTTPDIPAGPVESYRALGEEWANASNTPFRKYKTWDHEGGIATPFIAYWPKLIKNEGAIIHEPGHIIDIMPTCLSIADASYPAEFAGHTIRPMRGQALTPLFSGRARTWTAPLFWQFRDSKAVRKGDWKLVTRGASPWELYNIADDRTEMNDLAGTRPELVEALSALHAAWQQDVGVPVDGSLTKTR